MKLITQHNGLPTLKVEDPKLTYRETKWTSDRLRKLDEVAEVFNSEPSRVEIFSDAKFGKNPLVLTRKSTLDGFIKLFRDLNSGQAIIKHNIDTLMSAVALIKSRIEEKNIDDDQISETLKILGSVSSQISTEILVSGHPKDIRGSQATSDELAGLPED